MCHEGQIGKVRKHANKLINGSGTIFIYFGLGKTETKIGTS